LTGVAPVTRQSGKGWIVVRRQVCHPRLANAVYHWARVSNQHDPRSRAKYAELRRRGDSYGRALPSQSKKLDKRWGVPLSFSIICILSGGINSLAQARAGGGGASIGIGWSLGYLISGVLAVGNGPDRVVLSDRWRALSLELYPRKPLHCWLTAWLNLLGLITVLGATNVCTWGFFSGAIAPDSLRSVSTRARPRGSAIRSSLLPRLRACRR
jgi:hypothetical protein